MTLDDEYAKADAVRSHAVKAFTAAPGPSETRFNEDWDEITTALDAAIAKTRRLMGMIEKWKASEP